MGSAVHGPKWALGYKRFLRLCGALGEPSDAETYNSLCEEFGCMLGNLYILLGDDAFAWIDSPHVLALYKAKKAQSNEYDL